jgi:rhodanese-related sulfurtransferase
VPEAPLAEVISRLAAHDASLVLLDTRSADERAVSSIPGAIAVPEFEAAPPGTYDGKEVVTFCTVRA